MNLEGATEENVRQQRSSGGIDIRIKFQHTSQQRVWPPRQRAWSGTTLLLMTAAAMLWVCGATRAAASFQDSPAAAGSASPAPSAMIQPAVAELRETLGSLRVQKWKAPSAVKEDTGQNIGKIQTDLDSTLPGLLSQADATPGSIANAFGVYRNLDALYEVLLRVSGTADLAASDAEAAALSHALARLGDARRMLADSILNASHAQEAQLRQPRPAPQPAAAPPPPSTTVVSDGPAASPAHKKPKPRPKPAATPET